MNQEYLDYYAGQKIEEFLVHNFLLDDEVTVHKLVIALENYARKLQNKPERIKLTINQGT